MQTELFRIQNALVAAGTSDDPRTSLLEADRSLICLRTYLRLARELKLFSPGQFQHVSRLAAEVGKLLGGWQKKAAEK